MIANVASLMDLTPLHDGPVAEDVAQRLADRFGAIDDEEHRLLDTKTALDEVLQQRGPERAVLGRAGPDAERDLGAVDRDSESDQHRVSRELDAIDEHRDQVDVIELARNERGELLGRRVDQCARRVALARAARVEGTIDGIQTTLVAARGHSENDLLGNA